MVDVASIVVAVIALVASIGAAALTVGFSYLSEERKNQKESKALVAKYGDPLLLAAQDLQSRLFNITDWRVASYIATKDDRRDNLLLYTAFVFGQYFACAYILRRKTQFLRLETDAANRALTSVLADILMEWGEDSYGEDGSLFMLWRGDQMAIGQVMTVQEGDELFCMGYAEFRRRCAEDGLDYSPETRHRKWTLNQAGRPADPVEPSGQICASPTEVAGSPTGGENQKVGNGEFARWFGKIVNDVRTLATAKCERSKGGAEGPLISDQRLRRLQHLLVQLIHVLDEKGLRSEADLLGRCHRANICVCSTCEKQGSGKCDCKKCELRYNGTTP